MKRIEVLDGWRAASILLVLAGHLLPLGPKSWEMNGAVAALGMALFLRYPGSSSRNFYWLGQKLGCS